ncbi:MAG TPA: amidohydrolase family protein [Bacteroidia bacterium]|jgi:cytosine/adenosine deaminase-related metal-dependent hydrolase
MRKISADYIFPIASEPIRNGVVTISDNGTIISVEGPAGQSSEHYEGIICPGFINTHCHLELSHLRAQISENKGMTGFITELIGKRTVFTEDVIQQAIADAEAEMIRNGIVAVGDISNNNSTFSQKAKGNLRYHTFLEIFSMDPGKAVDTFNKGLSLEKELQALNAKLPHSIIPHAPYTMSEPLLELINQHAAVKQNILSIHNQESEGESELFISNDGVMFDAFRAMGIPVSFMRKTGVNSLQSTLPLLNKASKILLVHNTFTSKEDLQFIKSHLSNLTPQIYFCTCPNANKYIENRLPNYDIFIAENARVTIGTDSLASNWSLSVLDELKTITAFYPHLSLQTLLSWATKNGADFLNFDHLGTIEKGKKPGLNLLKNVDDLKITNATEVLKLA